MTYEEVLHFMRDTFPEWWEGHLSEFEEEGSGSCHMAAGTLVGLIGEAMALGAKQFADRAAAFADRLAESEDPRVENLLYVSFFENMDHMRLDDLRLIAERLSPRARGMLSEMVPEVDAPIGRPSRRK